MNHQLSRSSGISIPCGFGDGLPVGLQLSSSTREDLAVNIARLFESNTDYHLQPKIITMKITPIIGLEVHVELQTIQNVCSCDASHFHAEPNTHTCPVC